jgi:hypothetical protein
VPNISNCFGVGFHTGRSVPGVECYGWQFTSSSQSVEDTRWNGFSAPSPCVFGLTPSGEREFPWAEMPQK